VLFLARPFRVYRPLSSPPRGGNYVAKNRVSRHKSGDRSAATQCSRQTLRTIAAAQVVTCQRDAAAFHGAIQPTGDLSRQKRDFATNFTRQEGRQAGQTWPKHYRSTRTSSSGVAGQTAPARRCDDHLSHARWPSMHETRGKTPRPMQTPDGHLWARRSPMQPQAPRPIYSRFAPHNSRLALSHNRKVVFHRSVEVVVRHLGLQPHVSAVVHHLEKQVARLAAAERAVHAAVVLVDQIVERRLFEP
jgi:hypothetical protein